MIQTISPTTRFGRSRLTRETEVRLRSRQRRKGWTHGEACRNAKGRFVWHLVENEEVGGFFSGKHRHRCARCGALA